MSVKKNLENTSLSLKSQVGSTNNGKTRYKSYSYGNVDTAADDADMHFVALRLATLFEPSIDKITRQDVSELLEEVIY